MKTVRVGDIWLRMPCCSTYKDAVALAKTIKRDRKRNPKAKAAPKAASEMPYISIVGFEIPKPATENRKVK